MKKLFANMKMKKAILEIRTVSSAAATLCTNINSEPTEVSAGAKV
jgi:hypothetical protein